MDITKSRARAAIVANAELMMSATTAVEDGALKSIDLVAKVSDEHGAFLSADYRVRLTRAECESFARFTVELIVTGLSNDRLRPSELFRRYADKLAVEEMGADAGPSKCLGVPDNACALRSPAAYREGGRCSTCGKGPCPIRDFPPAGSCDT